MLAVLVALLYQVIVFFGKDPLSPFLPSMPPGTHSDLHFTVSRSLVGISVCHLLPYALMPLLLALPGLRAVWPDAEPVEKRSGIATAFAAVSRRLGARIDYEWKRGKIVLPSSSLLASVIAALMCVWGLPVFLISIIQFKWTSDMFLLLLRNSEFDILYLLSMIAISLNVIVSVPIVVAAVALFRGATWGRRAAICVLFFVIVCYLQMAVPMLSLVSFHPADVSWPAHFGVKMLLLVSFYLGALYGMLGCAVLMAFLRQLPSHPSLPLGQHTPEEASA